MTVIRMVQLRSAFPYFQVQSALARACLIVNVGQKMRTLTILLLALGIVGSAFASEREAAIEKRMNQRYDFAALSTFLQKLVAEHPSFEGISLASTKIGPKWQIEKIDPPRRMRGGDWVIWEKKEEDAAFDLYYQFDATHSVTARVKRLAKDRFELQRLSLEQWVNLR